MTALRGRALAFAMSAGEVGFLIPNFAFAALTPTFIAAWSMSNTEAGWVSGISGFGYMVSVPVLMSLTDRRDARGIFLAGATLSTIAYLGFALAAVGFWSALCWRALAGIGLAGTYMPGLRILTDRDASSEKSRAVAFYTATYSVGVSLSYLLAGLLADRYGWRTAFLLMSLGPFAALLVALLGIAPRRPEPGPPRRLLDFRPVFGNRRALAYILAYGAHGYELTAVRAWMVVFLSYAASAGGLGQWPGATIVAAIFSVIGLPSNVLGNELAVRFGRRRVLIAIMTASALLGIAIGFAAALPYAAVVAMILIYGVTCTADSGALTSGVISVSRPEAQGATMAVHSTVGFAAAFLGPLAVGMALDLAGGQAASFAWSIAFLVIALGALTGPLALWALGAEERT